MRANGGVGHVVRRRRAGIVSKSAEGLAKVIAVIATVFKAAGLTVSERWMGTMLLRTPGLYIPGSTVRHRTSWLEL